MAYKRFLWIWVAALASYALSLAYLYLPASRDPVAIEAQAFPAPNPAPPNPTGGPVLPRVSPSADPAREAGTAPQARSPAPAVEPTSPGGKPEELVPVTIMVARRDGNSEVMLRNQREDAAQVTLREVNPADGPGGQVQISLAGNEARTVGMSDGLALHSRDRLILHAEGFIDRETRVP